jgi:hypothetical protein
MSESKRTTLNDFLTWVRAASSALSAISLLKGNCFLAESAWKRRVSMDFPRRKYVTIYPKL